MKPTLTRGTKIVLGVALATIAIVLIVVFSVRANRRHMKDVPQIAPGSNAASEQGEIPASEPEKGSYTQTVVAAPEELAVAHVSSVVTSISSKPGDSDTDTKRGTFSILFNVKAKDRDVYFNPSCQSVASAASMNGVTFALIKDGERADNSRFTADSCAVLNRGMSEKTTAGNYLIKKGAENVFELVVVDHPTEHGSYKVRVTAVGYSETDSLGTTYLPVTQYDLDRMKTQALSL